MEIRKKLGAKKAEKSLEISAFLVFSRSDLNRPKDMCYHYEIDPYKAIVQKQSMIFTVRIDLSLGDDGSCTRPLSSGVQRHACKRVYVFSPIFNSFLYALKRKIFSNKKIGIKRQPYTPPVTIPHIKYALLSI